MKKRIKNSQLYFVFALIATLISSCNVNSNIMFKTTKNDIVHYDSIPMNPSGDYLISIDDKITFQLYTNEGEVILTSNADINGRTVNGSSQIEYLVRRDGTVDLPKIGAVKLNGFSAKQAEVLLQEMYSNEYQKPFVQVQIANQRVVVFPGNGGDAKVITLVNNNTTLMEALALAGGITDRGRANRIKLIRRDASNQRHVYNIDLSTLEGLKYVDLVVQANDYIYVEPSPQITREVMKDVAPVISILSSALIIFTFINNLK